MNTLGTLDWNFRFRLRFLAFNFLFDQVPSLSRFLTKILSSLPPPVHCPKTLQLNPKDRRVTVVRLKHRVTGRQPPIIWLDGGGVLFHGRRGSLTRVPHHSMYTTTAMKTMRGLSTASIIIYFMRKRTAKKID